MSYHSYDENLEESTNKWMIWGLVFMAIMILIFPLYLWLEPTTRADALATQNENLAAEGSELFTQNCTSCHGPNGEGGVGPALNSQQFLATTKDAQISSLISVGIPGSLMAAYSVDYGGPLTSEQIRAITAHLRLWEEDAPDNPDWRSCCG